MDGRSQQIMGIEERCLSTLVSLPRKESTFLLHGKASKQVEVRYKDQELVAG